MKKLLNTLIVSFLIIPAFAQSTARLQAIHNSADAAAQTVDVWLTTPMGSSLLVDDFSFRTATPYIDAPAGVNITISIAPASSTAITDTITGLSSTYNLMANETYVVVADGIVSATGYSPAPAFNLSVSAIGQEMATTTGNTDVLVHHGSTDAPMVDVRERTLGLTVVDDASYGDFAGYLELPTADYILDVLDATGTINVRSYSAPLSTLGLTDSALVVVASGFLDPSMNSNGSGFGLYVALPGGGNLIPLPLTDAPNARVNIIHNSPDMAASMVDIYVNGALAVDDFEFRTATGFINLPAAAALQVGIAPSTSTSVADTITTFNYNLGIDEKYIIIADGIVSATGYSPTQAFDLKVFAMGRESAATAGNTDILVHHGSTDAPTVDVDEVTAGNIVDNASYGNFAGYLELPTADYTLEVKDETGTTVVKTYEAPLSTLSLEGEAITVIASGFLDPSMNSDGAAFGLYVALAAGGDLVALPEVNTTSINSLNKVDLNVFPNPTTGFLNIEKQEELVSLQLTDVLGRVVATEKDIENNKLNITNIPTGIYQLVIRLKNNELSYTNIQKI
ncbi:MAG: hypothetical protein ACI8ZX_002129 [Planctomycetota bacterium]|jgi:hypothetical protein